MSTDPETYLQQAMQEHQQGNLYDADLLYAQALQINPNNIQALRLKGILKREYGDIDESLKLFTQASKLNPKDAEHINEIALSHMAAGNLQQAEQSLRHALHTDPESIKALTNLGALLQQRGHIQEAIHLYQMALEIQPDDVQLRCNYAKTLSDAGEDEQALQQCETALKQSSDHPYVLTVKGAVLLDQKCYEEAGSILETARLQGYEEDMALVNLALALYQTGDIKSATKILQRAITLNPYNARAVADLTNCHCTTGNYADALTLCEEFLKQHPGERLVLGAYALALHNAGQSEQALTLSNCTKLVHVFDLDTPKGFADLNVFNNALASQIRSDSSLLTNPVSKSTYGGDQTGELDMEASLASKALLTFIQDSVTSVANQFMASGLDKHPVMAPANGTQMIRAWGTLIRAGGQQTAHMHPLGWLSGVYYAHLPPDMGAASAEAGWLEFNKPPERFYCEAEPDTRRYEPREGRLIIFPSWFWHQTFPFESKDERISIAFDIVPLEALRMI
ncbi:MAG: tetratricopeptide repeat protein [Gammaproteobacteria bacterium]|nr:tetratricopeptide repeat protein [Gammaproteobacteria bacterium]MCP4089404.1 tetratricopeptide repeat protein [Gammaproteobacteria bacterium]MCP4277519.1 tetratricopeptide repeat protein [Gammaproteobacteria bacterium]MCP4831127.1 tetratricopeptide repeat protein [Gammaproteobacteria bacterium]MCP4928550.1 tetratricopeptide repeat protein [Gammaproteobacteria bacterium]